MKVEINRQNFQSVSNLTISADLHGILAAREFLYCKSQFHACSQKQYFYTLQFNTLQPAYIWKYFEILYMKGQDNLQNTSVNIKSCPS